MRQFDYTTVPAELEATPITNLLLSIREHKGRQLALSQVKPELLSSLMEEAKIQSTRSSNGLEGIVTTQKDSKRSWRIPPSQAPAQRKKLLDTEMCCRLFTSNTIPFP